MSAIVELGGLDGHRGTCWSGLGVRNRSGTWRFRVVELDDPGMGLGGLNESKDRTMARFSSSPTSMMKNEARAGSRSSKQGLAGPRRRCRDSGRRDLAAAAGPGGVAGAGRHEDDADELHGHGGRQNWTDSRAGRRLGDAGLEAQEDDGCGHGCSRSSSPRALGRRGRHGDQARGGGSSSVVAGYEARTRKPRGGVAHGVALLVVANGGGWRRGSGLVAARGSGRRGSRRGGG